MSGCPVCYMTAMKRLFRAEAALNAGVESYSCCGNTATYLCRGYALHVDLVPVWE